MEAARNQGSQGRGSTLLLEHFAVLEGDDDARSPAYARLEETIGSPLARLLVGALGTSGGQGRRRRFNG
jgi:hypothetical protein